MFVGSTCISMHCTICMWYVRLVVCEGSVVCGGQWYGVSAMWEQRYGRLTVCGVSGMLRPVVFEVSCVFMLSQ